MTKREQVLNKLINEGNLKEFDTINIEYIGMYQKYGTNIIKSNEAPTLLTKCSVGVVLYE